MPRSWPIGLAILYLRGAIDNYEEHRTEEYLKALKHARWKAGRGVTPFRKSNIRHIFEIDYLKSLNIEIRKATSIIYRG